MRRLNPESHYGISKTRWGWSVALVRQGVRYTKAFNASIYGDWDLALLYAQRWRDDIVEAHPPELRRERAMRPRANSSGPTPGVTPELDHQGNIKLWRAKTSLGLGKVLQRTFSLARWGAAAQEMALAERAWQLQQMTGASHVHRAELALRTQLSEGAPPRPPLPSLTPAPQPRLRRSNSSGVSGVVRRAGRGKHGGYWTAQTVVGGRWISRSFPVDRHGEEQARLLAIEERARQLASLRGQAGSAPPSCGRPARRGKAPG